jgi:CO/xanthine dehydrogenase Mo-binding subunit
MEPMFDSAARQLGIDRVAIRKINAPDSDSKIGSDRGPLTSAFQKEALHMGAAMFKWDERKQKSGQRAGSKVTGIGIGQGYHSAGSNGFDGLVRITPDGKLHVHTGVGNLGTYSHAATARVAADMLNYDWDNVIVERGDSRRGLPWNSNQAGSLTASTESRTMYVAAMDAPRSFWTSPPRCSAARRTATISGPRRCSARPTRRSRSPTRRPPGRRWSLAENTPARRRRRTSTRSPRTASP